MRLFNMPSTFVPVLLLLLLLSSVNLATPAPVVTNLVPSTDSVSDPETVTSLAQVYERMGPGSEQGDLFASYALRASSGDDTGGWSWIGVFFQKFGQSIGAYWQKKDKEIDEIRQKRKRGEISEQEEQEYFRKLGQDQKSFWTKMGAFFANMFGGGPPAEPPPPPPPKEKIHKPEPNQDALLRDTTVHLSDKSESQDEENGDDSPGLLLVAFFKRFGETMQHYWNKKDKEIDEVELKRKRGEMTDAEVANYFKKLGDDQQNYWAQMTTFFEKRFGPEPDRSRDSLSTSSALKIAIANIDTLWNHNSQELYTSTDLASYHLLGPVTVTFSLLATATYLYRCHMRHKSYNLIR